MELEITSLARARKIKRRGFDAIITLENHDDRMSGRLRFHQQPRPAHLILVFSDIDTELPGIPAATPEQITRAVEFASGREKLLVHCYAGRGRSTAVAYAVLADQYGPGREREALAMVYQVQPLASPSIMTLKAADIALNRDGRLEQVLHEMEAERPDAVAFRAYKQKWWLAEAERMARAGTALRPQDQISELPLPSLA